MGGTITRSNLPNLVSESPSDNSTDNSSLRSNISKLNFDDGTYFSERNIWFSSSSNEAINTSEYDRPILASNRSGIQNL